MKQICFDPTNQEAMNAMMDEHGKSKTMYPGTNHRHEHHSDHLPGFRYHGC